MFMPTLPSNLRQRLVIRYEGFLRVVLSHYVANGLSVSLGLVFIMLLIFESAGLLGAASGAVGVLVTSLPDVPAPRRRKVMQMLPALLLGAPLFMLVQLTHHDDLLLGVVLVAGTFLAVMLMAWGKRGGPLTFSLLFSMLFSMAAPPTGRLMQIFEHGGWFTLGSMLYLIWGVLSNNALNARYRAQLLAECMDVIAQILRTQAKRFDPQADPQSVLGSLLAQQSALADLLQTTRDVVLESPTTPVRQRLAAMLLTLMEVRDQQLACDLDVAALLSHPSSAGSLVALREVLNTTARHMERLSLALLLGHNPQAMVSVASQRAHLQTLLPPRVLTALPPGPSPEALLHNTVERVSRINDEIVKLAALARGDLPPELAAVRTNWQLFVGTTRWAWAPLLGQLTWRAPTLRYALRATLAMGVGYAVSLHLPWATHKYWILTTIVVVMRGNLAQTLERRNARVVGTLIGSVLVIAVLAMHPSTRLLFLTIGLGMGLAHAFALRVYMVSTVASTLSGLLQAHLLRVGAVAVTGVASMAPALSNSFAISERVADTLLGAALAWLFSYVLPAWERGQLPGLLRRNLHAQNQHAQRALALLEAAHTADVPWRLARREAYDSLAALTQASQRSQSEPRQVRLSLAPLEAVQVRSYQLMAQLTAIKAMLLVRRSQLNEAVVIPALAEATKTIRNTLVDAVASDPMVDSAAIPITPATPSDTATATMLDDDDLSPWLLRRLALACDMAFELKLAVKQARADARRRRPGKV